MRGKGRGGFNEHKGSYFPSSEIANSPTTSTRKPERDLDAYGGRAGPNFDAPEHVLSTTFSKNAATMQKLVANSQGPMSRQRGPVDGLLKRRTFNESETAEQDARGSSKQSLEGAGGTVLGSGG